MARAQAPAAAHGSVEDLIGWRMRALGLWQQIPGAGAEESASSGAERVHAVAERLLALQGQDWNAVRWALGLRAPGTTDADVLEAFNARRLVRSWPMRGTIHVVPAEDIGWMQAATNHRVLPGAAKRREFIGLDDAALELMTEVAIERLSGGNALSRDELGKAWAEAGVTGHPDRGLGAWRYHVIWWLSQNGLIVAGPVDAGGGEPRFRLTEEWIADPRRLEGEAALAELAVRFARGRGPVLDKDLAWWTGLTLRDARAGLAAAASADRLETVVIDDRTYWAEPELLAGPSGAPEGGSMLLLPGFDEHLLGYTDREAVLDQANFERIVPGRNGMFRATVVEDGRVVGVWTRTARAKSTRIQVEPFPGKRIDLGRLEPAAAAWSAFQGVDVELTAAPADAG